MYAFSKITLAMVKVNEKRLKSFDVSGGSIGGGDGDCPHYGVEIIFL